MDKLKKYVKYLGYVGCGLIIIGLFLPLVKATITLFGYSASTNVSYISSGDGKVLLGVTILAIVMMVIKKKKVNMSIIGFSTVLFIYDMINMGKVVGSSTYNAKISYGIGFYLLVLGLISCIAYVFLDKEETSDGVDYNQSFSNQNNTPAFNQLNQNDSMLFDSYTNQPVEPVMSQPVEQTVQQPIINQPVEPLAAAQDYFCQQCGTKLPAGSTSCYVCGKQII